MSRRNGCKNVLPCNVIGGFAIVIGTSHRCLVLSLLGLGPSSCVIATLIMRAHPERIDYDIIQRRSSLLLFLQGFVGLSISFALLMQGASMISPAEVSLMMLIETVLGPFLVWLGGYEQPPLATIYYGAIIIFALIVHR